ncbi:MAG: hypothetical protein RIF32_12835 [Leptospirales bacterium]|jgi:opacity protein-like surface antigen
MSETNNRFRSKVEAWLRLAAITAILLPQAAFADGFVFGLEALNGSNHYELDRMLADDVAVTDDWTSGSLSATNKWNTPWVERRRPLGLASLFYEHQVGQVVLLAGVKHSELKTSFDYTSYKLKPGSSAFALPVSVQISERVDDVEIGVKLPLAPIGLASLVLTPRLGHRTENFRARYAGSGGGRDESGGHNFLLNKKARLDDKLAGMYGGAEVEFKLTSKLHFFVGAYLFGLHGDKTEVEFEGEILDNLVVEELGVEYIATSVRSNGAVYTGGIKYKLTDSWHLHLGYTYERFRVSYPDYTNLLRMHYTNGSGASLEIPSHADLITDRLIYGRQKLREKRHIFLGVNYDLHL